MAVVNKYASRMRVPGMPRKPVSAALAGGASNIQRQLDDVAIANGDSANSTALMAIVPSKAIMLPESKIYHSAITGLNDLDFGDATNPDGLVDGISCVSAGSDSAIKAVAFTDYDKPLWELLGMASDPGGDIELFVTLNAAATTGGTIAVDLRYIVAG